MAIEIEPGKLEISGTLDVTFPPRDPVLTPEAGRWLSVMHGQTQPEDLSTTVLLMDLPQRIQWAINEVKLDEANKTKLWKLTKIAEFLYDLERAHPEYGRKHAHLQRALLYRSLDLSRDFLRHLDFERLRQDEIRQQIADLRHLVGARTSKSSILV